MAKRKHSKKCKCCTDKIQYALWKRPKDLHGDEFLIDALEMQIFSSEMRRMNEDNTNNTKITVIPFEEDSYDSYILRGEYWCFFSEADQLELFQRNSTGVMTCFLTHEHLYEVGMNSMIQLSEAHKNHFKIEAEASINKATYERIIKLMKDNVEHCLTLFGRRDQDPITNLLNRQWLLKIESIRNIKPEILCDTCKWNNQLRVCDHPFVFGGAVGYEMEDAFNLNKIECKFYENKTV